MTAPIHLRGVVCAPGRSAGRIWCWPRAQTGQLSTAPPSGALELAWAAVRQEIELRRARLVDEDPEALGLLEVQHWLMADPHFEGHARQLAQRGLSARAAIAGAVDHAVATLRAPGDALLASRCTDVQQLGERLHSALYGIDGRMDLPPRPSVLAAVDLPPDVLLELLGAARQGRTRRVRAVLLAKGGPLTHTAILARQRGVPLIGGLRGLLAQVYDGQGVLVHGGLGQAVLEPNRTSLQWLHDSRLRATPVNIGLLPTQRRLGVCANLDQPEDVVRARELGAEGVGLLRTDSLLGPGGAPGVDEQVRRYGTALRAWPGGRVVIRLFDAPTDGALGPRGIRWLTLCPERTRNQVMALCRAAAQAPETHLGILAPMVSRGSELQELRALVQSCFTGPGPAPEVGAMVETPAAALDVDGVLDEADFVAVGTNDLLQLLVGASRDDPRVAPLLDPEHPALWRLLAQVGATCAARGRRAVLCGALAADPRAIARIAGLGFDAVSVGLADLRRVRRLVGADGTHQHRAKGGPGTASDPP